MCYLYTREIIQLYFFLLERVFFFSFLVFFFIFLFLGKHKQKIKKTKSILMSLKKFNQFSTVFFFWKKILRFYLSIIKCATICFVFLILFIFNINFQTPLEFYINHENYNLHKWYFFVSVIDNFKELTRKFIL